jgi:hypothetical protein
VGLGQEPPLVLNERVGARRGEEALRADKRVTATLSGNPLATSLSSPSTIIENSEALRAASVFR